MSARWRLSLCAIIAAAGLWAAQGAPAEARDAKKPAAEPAEANADPLKLVISLKKQRVQVYRGADLVATSRVSTGKRGYGTPSGIYSILEKRRWHRSNIYSGAPMPFMQRITWSGIALHAGRVPNYPASHGCIRLPAKFAESLFSITAKGAHVVVVRDEAAPKPFDHVALFQPSVPPKLDYASAGTPVSEPVPFDVEPGLAAVGRRIAYEQRSDKPLRILITRRTGRERMMDVQRLLNELGHEAGDVDGYMGKNTWNAVQSFQTASGLPPTGIVTDDLVAALHEAAGRGTPANGHLYVRQGFKDVFDAPVRILLPDVPLGTHIYTAQDFSEDDRKVAWTALSADDVSPDGPGAALSRIDIAEQVREKISQMLTPGTSVIITDTGIGRETGKGTDFVVQTKSKRQREAKK